MVVSAAAAGEVVVDSAEAVEAVVTAEASAIVTVGTVVELVDAEVVASAEAEVVVPEAAVARNVREIGRAESAAIRTLPGETSATVARPRRVMVLPVEAAAVVVSEVVAVDRSEAAHETAAVVAVEEASVVATATEDTEVVEVVVVPCAEVTGTATSDNGRTKPELADIPLLM